jgi:hypothetical protein
MIELISRCICQAQYQLLPKSLARFSPADPNVIIYAGYGMQKQIQFYSISQKKVGQWLHVYLFFPLHGFHCKALPVVSVLWPVMAERFKGSGHYW